MVKVPGPPENQRPPYGAYKLHNLRRALHTYDCGPWYTLSSSSCPPSKSSHSQHTAAQRADRAVESVDGTSTCVRCRAHSHARTTGTAAGRSDRQSRQSGPPETLELYSVGTKITPEARTTQ
eukprot:2076190-Prymnesium_polylepis.1